MFLMIKLVPSTPALVSPVMCQRSSGISQRRIVLASRVSDDLGGVADVVELDQASAGIEHGPGRVDGSELFLG